MNVAEVCSFLFLSEALQNKLHPVRISLWDVELIVIAWSVEIK
jgi:hypothetical protein